MVGVQGQSGQSPELAVWISASVLGFAWLHKKVLSAERVVCLENCCLRQSPSLPIPAYG